MKHLFYISILVFLSSCGSTYFYSTLSTSDKKVERVENGDFLIETDSLWIAYCFKGMDAPIQITIFNKLLDEPLYINWEKSGFILDSITYPYTGANAILYDNDNLSSNIDYAAAVENGDIEMSEKISTIPPQTMLSNIPFYIMPDLFDLNKKLFIKASMGNKNGEVKGIERADFDEEDSPFKFKSNLTIYAQEDQPMLFTQDFYLKNHIKTKSINPENLADDLAEKGDVFYSIKRRDNSVLYTVVGSIAIAGVAIIVADGDSMPVYEDY